MKAIYGKINIGLSVVFWVLIGIGCLVVPDLFREYMHDAFLLIGVMMLALLIGMIHAIIGVVKKKSPKALWITGLLACLGVVVFVLYGIFGSNK